jgi:hypothetical protein
MGEKAEGLEDLLLIAEELSQIVMDDVYWMFARTCAKDRTHEAMLKRHQAYSEHMRALASTLEKINEHVVRPFIALL